MSRRDYVLVFIDDESDDGVYGIVHKDACTKINDIKASFKKDQKHFSGIIILKGIYLSLNTLIISLKKFCLLKGTKAQVTNEATKRKVKIDFTLDSIGNFNLFFTS